MIVTSVHDPEVFDPILCADPQYKALMIDHLMHMSHCHIIICDANNDIEIAMNEHLSGLTDSIAPYLTAAISPQRIVHRHIAADLYNQLAPHFTNSNPGSPAALSFSCSPEVDAILTTDYGLNANKKVNSDQSRVFTMGSYAGSPFKRREYQCMGAKSINDMPLERFRNDIIKPIVKYAETVILIDKMFCRSRFNEDPAKRNISNWSRYKRTIRAIYDTWHSECVLDKNEFVIITTENKQWGQAWNSTKCQTMPGDCDAQAQYVANDLNLRHGRYAVKIIRDNKSKRDIHHDRYLVTNRDLTVTFSRGLDLIESNNMAIECGVSLYRRSDSDPVSEILKENIIGKAVIP